MEEPDGNNIIKTTLPMLTSRILSYMINNVISSTSSVQDLSSQKMPTAKHDREGLGKASLDSSTLF